jgi:hypothetical protein
MATYYWDLGFDANAVQNPNNSNQSYLQNGFVLMQQPNNLPATPVNLNVGDMVGFNVFNVTDLPEGTYSIAGGSITFQSAVVNQSNSSPFSSSSITISPTSVTGSGPSIIFSGIQANATKAQILGAVSFPIYGIQAPQAIVNNGRFLVQVTLEITGPNGTQTFFHDPEMVVGSVG